MTPAERQRIYRARSRRGQAVLRVKVNFYAVAEALIQSERLSCSEAEDRAKIEAELAQVVAEWAKIWLKQSRYA
jgi:hypothetical protein